MFKKIGITLTICSLIVPTIASSSTINGANEAKSATNANVANELKYASNAFTQTNESVKKVKNQHNLKGFEKVGENEALELYVDPAGLAIRMKDKRSGYIWSSTAPNMENERLNSTWKNFINSALTIEYVDRKEKVKKESILDNNSRVTLIKTDNGFVGAVRFLGAKIEMEIVVSLLEDGISITIPEDSIKEKGKNRLSNVQVYPFLGATKQNEIPGYMFIPDGTGALIRYQDLAIGSSQAYMANVYNKDKGFEGKSKNNEKIIAPEQIHVPVYGVVHGEKQNALMTTITSGEQYTQVSAYPSGVSTEFNWMSSTFHYRYQYFQPTSKDLKGINVYQKDMNKFDASLRVKLLTNDEADYVGMAKAYQADLSSEGILTKKTDDSVQMRLEFLGAERKEGLFFDSVIEMTKIEDIKEIIKDLQENDTSNLEVVYRGWSKGGYSGSFPNKLKIESALGSKGELEKLAKELKKAGIPFSLYTDYVRADAGAKGYSENRDLAKKISVGPIEKNKNGYLSYYFSPKKSLDLFVSSKDFLKDVGVMGISMDTIGSELFSDSNQSSKSTREKTQESYQLLGKEANEAVDRVAIYKPNDYMYSYSDVIYDIPMNSSRYQYFTDTVPFLPIVLKGYIDYYAPFSNFFADTDDVLKMVEYGAFPSFYLTKEPTFDLQNTGLKDLYTTEYANWKEEILNQYNLVQKYLAPVQGEEIVGRTVIATGVVKVDYSNNMSLVINYTEQDYKDKNYEVSANEVISVKGE